jgi:glycosyltransferase involved in cell wall biosynthesis
LVKKLRLKEDHDFLFLGSVTDTQLKFLYERSSVIIKPGMNCEGGSSLLEAAYFGRPVVGFRHPATEYLLNRFLIPTHFFALNDAPAVADALALALADDPLIGPELEKRQESMRNPEFSIRRYAERLYECLVELGETGRSTQTGSQLAA